VNEAIEPFRRDKTIGTSLEAEVGIPFLEEVLLDGDELNLSELFITASAGVSSVLDQISVTKTTNHKCGRCWRHLPEVVDDGALCGRCEDVVGG
jgi:isoleucyl-tRNA synthetase